MVVPSPKVRKIIFFVGLALILAGGVGLALLHDLWLNILTSIFTVSGTTMSFAQFALGFGTIKPPDAPVTPKPAPTPLTVTQPSSEPIATLTAPNDTISLGTTQIAIGRAPDNQHIIHDPQTSGYHAVIHSRGQEYTITDLGSTNGTFVNGQRLIANVPCTFHSGDTIRIGTTTFTYEVKHAPALAKTLPAMQPHAPTSGTVSTNAPSASPDGADTMYASPPIGAKPNYTPPLLPAYGASPNYAAPQIAYAVQPMYAPPPPPGSLNTPTRKPQRSYRRTAIALFLASLCLLLEIYAIYSPQTPDHYRNIWSIAILGDIFLLCSLRGIQAKQEHKAGWFGIIGITLNVSGTALNIIMGIFFVGNYIPNVPFIQAVPPQILTLYYVTLVFTVFGNILYGISIIRARVYPLWTGIILIIVGVLTPVPTLSVLNYALLIVLLTSFGVILFKQPTAQYQQPSLR